MIKTVLFSSAILLGVNDSDSAAAFTIAKANQANATDDEGDRDQVYVEMLVSLHELRLQIDSGDRRPESLGRYIRRFSVNFKRIREMDAPKPNIEGTVGSMKVASSDVVELNSASKVEQIIDHSNRVKNTHRLPNLKLLQIRSRRLGGVTKQELNEFCESIEELVVNLESNISSIGFKADVAIQMLDSIDEKLIAFERSTNHLEQK